MENSIISKVFLHSNKTTLYLSVIKSFSRKSGASGNSAFSGFSLSKLLSPEMTKEEALKILNLKEKEATPKKIIEKFEKYLECNDPYKGGSFYIQNKVFYAKELLMEKFPRELNASKYNPDSEPVTERVKEKLNNKI